MLLMATIMSTIRSNGRITIQDNSGMLGVGSINVGFDAIGKLLFALNEIVCSNIGIDGVFASVLTEITIL